MKRSRKDSLRGSEEGILVGLLMEKEIGSHMGRKYENTY